MTPCSWNINAPMKVLLSTRMSSWVLLATLLMTNGFGGFIPSLAEEATSDPPAKSVEKTVEKKSPKKDLKKPERTPDSAFTLTEPQKEELKKLSSGTQTELKSLYESLHGEDHSISQELMDEEEVAVSDMAMLWQAAVERSGTIRYAIEKLSRKTATGKPVQGDNFSKRMISSIARVGSMAGAMVTGSPASLIGGSMVEEMMASDPMADPSALQITDADMLILAKEVEALQTEILESYFSYRHAWERVKLHKEHVLTISNHTSEAQNTTPEVLMPLLDTLEESAKQEEEAAKREYVSARNALALLTGNEAVIALDQEWDKPASSSVKGQ